ncbi:MAG TPA: hypothetical protein VEX39_09685 [Thermoleophilaceae bacterium]|nr:hypothetical protein [Thermoleophilaceae bacterium]
MKWLMLIAAYGVWLLVPFGIWVADRQDGGGMDGACAAGEFRYRAAAELDASIHDVSVEGEGLSWPPAAQRCTATAPAGQVSEQFPGNGIYLLTAFLALAPLVFVPRWRRWMDEV